MGSNGVSLTVKGAFTVNNGAGSTVQNGINFAAQNVTLGGVTSITGTSGFDRILFGVGLGGDRFTAGPITINSGDGGTSYRFLAETTTINGNLSVKNGAGDDALSVLGKSFTVNGNLTMSNGSGDSDFDLKPSIKAAVTGATSITSTAGNDTETLGLTGTAVTLGSLAMNLGNGDVDAELHGDVTVNSTLNVRAGTGAHTVFADGTQFHVNGNTTIAFGRGRGLLEFLATSQNSFGNVTATSLDGFEEVAFRAATTLNSLTVNNQGNNDDSIGSLVAFFGDTTINAALTINGGPGEDKFEAEGAIFPRQSAPQR